MTDAAYTELITIRPAAVTATAAVTVDTNVRDTTTAVDPTWYTKLILGHDKRTMRTLVTYVQEPKLAELYRRLCEFETYARNRDESEHDQLCIDAEELMLKAASLHNRVDVDVIPTYDTSKLTPGRHAICCSTHSDLCRIVTKCYESCAKLAAVLHAQAVNTRLAARFENALKEALEVDPNVISNHVVFFYPELNLMNPTRLLCFDKRTIPKYFGTFEDWSTSQRNQIVTDNQRRLSRVLTASDPTTEITTSDPDTLTRLADLGVEYQIDCMMERQKASDAYENLYIYRSWSAEMIKDLIHLKLISNTAELEQEDDADIVEVMTGINKSNALPKMTFMEAMAICDEELRLSRIDFDDDSSLIPVKSFHYYNDDDGTLKSRQSVDRVRLVPPPKHTRTTARDDDDDDEKKKRKQDKKKAKIAAKKKRAEKKAERKAERKAQHKAEKRRVKKQKAEKKAAAAAALAIFNLSSGIVDADIPHSAPSTLVDNEQYHHDVIERKRAHADEHVVDLPYCSMSDLEDDDVFGERCAKKHHACL